MLEILKTVQAELLRLKGEGVDSVSVDDESMEILKKLIAKNSAQAPKSTKNEYIEEVHFAQNVDLGKAVSTEKPVKVKTVKDFNIKPIPAPTPFEIKGNTKSEKWECLKNIVLNDKVCLEHVHEGKNLVFGVGSIDSPVFFCGEAPGADEETQGEPFVGRAGQLLTKIIKAMGLDRKDVYIGNIMNWRPELPTLTGNRPPDEVEMAYCLPFLKAQIEIVNPKVIVALGKTAAVGLLGASNVKSLGAVRGRWHNYMDRKLMITYHPSYLLQYATPKTKRTVWEDMMLVMEELGMPISEKQRGYFL